MCEIYSNENNPFALKLIIAANFGGHDFNLKIINLKDVPVSQPKYLPYLVCKNCKLFLANAASHFLFPPNKANESVVDQWLEWESNILSVNLVKSFSQSERTSKNSLKNCFRTLNDAIGNSLSLTGDAISLCDIVIWSTLYSFYKDEKLRDEHLCDFENVTNWMKKLENQQNFQKSLSQFSVLPGSTAYQVLGISAKYILLDNFNTEVVNNVLTSQHSTEEGISINDINSVKAAWLNSTSKLPQLKQETVPVLPKPGEKNILITSALPYVNNVPHLGNIIGCVLSADVFARFNRLCNRNTLFICGTDEYGTATETKALEENLTPQQICDKYFEIHNSIYRWFNIGFDYFGRTTTKEQTQITQDIFLELNRNGFMQVQAVEQLLCEKCNRYLADRFVEGICPHLGCNYEDARGDQCDGCGKLVNATELKNPRCKVCSTTPIIRQSDQFFLDLPKLEPLLQHWLEKSSPGWSNNARIIARSWIKEGLKPRCITRDLKWGVSVPIEGFTNKVFYVWFDAPIGYLSISARYTKEWKKWWQPEKGTQVTLYQFMAKDNVPFHSVMFPATLLGLNSGYTTVSHIMATEYLNYEDGKFSKSRGIGVFGNDAQNTGIPSDVWRFYLLYVRPETQDSSFSWNDLATKNNSELLNNLGNFINRAQVFAEKFFDSVIPPMDLDEEDYSFLALCTKEFKGFVISLEKAKLRDGIRHILAISRHGNQYIQSSAPWVLIKGSQKEKEKAATVIGVCCNIACLLATLLSPYMPDTSRILKKQLNAPDNVKLINGECPEITVLLKNGHILGKPSPLFTKIDLDMVEQLKKQFAGKQKVSQNNDQVEDLAALESSVALQADKVRALKSSNVDKSVWQPEVTILLNLKKRLESTLKSKKHNGAENKDNLSINQNGLIETQSVKELQGNVDKQAELVRTLKSSGASKAEWQPQVNVLLNLKEKLAIATGAPRNLNTKKNKK